MTAEEARGAGPDARLSTASPSRAPGAPTAPDAHAPHPPTAPDAQASGAPTAHDDGLWVERRGTRTYRGHNTRGAVVDIGPVTADDVFSPGELMKLALAGCSGMTADNALARRLGDDVRVVVHVSGPTDRREVRYPSLREELVVDLSALGDEDTERVLSIVRRAIDKYCTVGRTLEHSADVDLTIMTDAPVPAGSRT